MNILVEISFLFSLTHLNPEIFLRFCCRSNIVGARLHSMMLKCAEWVEHIVKRFITSICVYLHEFSAKQFARKNSTGHSVEFFFTSPSDALIFSPRSIHAN